MTKKSPSLNPRAASYVPVSGGKFVSGSEHESKITNDDDAAAIRPVHQTTPSSKPGGESIASSSQHQVPSAEESSWVEDFESDMARLQKAFPGFAHDSLVRVYVSNMCDLEATIDIINQAKIDVPPSSVDNPVVDFLPENLDIDVSEYLSKRDGKKEGSSSTSSPSRR